MKSFVAIFVVLALLVLAAPAMSQGFKGIGGGLEIAMPMGDFGDAANMGFGFTAAAQYGWKPNIDLIGQIGYLSWGAKDLPAGFDGSWSAIPIQVGAKYYFGQTANRFYAGGLAGFHMFKVKATVDLPYLGKVSSSASETKFGFAPMVGYEMKLGQKMMLDLSGRYQFVSDNLSYIGIRAGIIYLLK
jgi:opacity protein-like surface antigen